MAESSADFVQLRVNGRAFFGFERGVIQLTMVEGANSFDVQYVADGKQPGVRAIFEGDEVDVAVDAGAGKGFEVLVSGYVDTVDDEDDPDGIVLRSAGRSRTCDLIDCSAINKPGRWSNITVGALAAALCEPFDIDVYVESDEGAPFPHFSVQKGETPYDAISRAALKRGLLAYAVADSLVLAKAGDFFTGTVLERGGRVIRSARSNSWYARYSEYIFKAQARATDNNWGKGPNQLKHTVTDDTVSRHRPLLIQAEAHDGVDLRTRAILERNVRAGMGERVTCLVDGWATDEGNAWRPNTLVQFVNPVLGIDAAMLITVCRYRFGANEAREVELEMTLPQAFDVSANYPNQRSNYMYTSKSKGSRVTRKDR